MGPIRNSQFAIPQVLLGPLIIGPQVLLGLLALALAIATIVIIFVWLRGRSKTRDRTGPAVSVSSDATVVFRPEHRGGNRPAATVTMSLPDDDDGTYLIPLQGDDGTPGQAIPILARSLYIGRDQSRAQIVFDDPTVSRLHARLVEEVEGVFMLHDEGSASGTFVNDERIDLQPRELHSGDLIEFGRQRVIFQSAEPLGQTFASFASQGPPPSQD